MRVLQITNDYFNSSVYENLQKAFLKYGLDSFIFVPSSFSDPNRDCEQSVIYERCFSKWDRLTYQHKQKKIYRKLKEHIQKLSPDVLHSHFLFSGGYACYKANKEFGIPYITAVQNTDINVYYKYMYHLRKLGLKVLLNADNIVFISKAYLEFFLDRYVPKELQAIIRDKSVIIPFPINDFWIQNRMSDKPCPVPGTIKLITVGVITPNKNQITVAKAAEILIRQGYQVEYLVIGKIINQSYYNKLTRYPFVKHIAHCSKEDLIMYYRQADILVMPSIYESFGLVYAEAMSQGLPVIYTRGQGFDEQFPEGEVGYHVEANSAKSVAEAIKRVTEEYDVISKKAAEKASRFNWENIVRDYVLIYKSILCEKGCVFSESR